MFCSLYRNAFAGDSGTKCHCLFPQFLFFQTICYLYIKRPAFLQRHAFLTFLETMKVLKISGSLHAGWRSGQKPAPQLESITWVKNNLGGEVNVRLRRQNIFVLLLFSGMAHTDKAKAREPDFNLKNANCSIHFSVVNFQGMLYLVL